MPVPETPGKMYWCLTYGTHGVRKYVGFDSLDRQAGWHAIIPRAQWLSMREGSLCRYGQQGPEEQENQSRSQAKYRGAEQRYVHSPRWPLQSILNDPKTVATVPVSRLPNRCKGSMGLAPRQFQAAFVAQKAGCKKQKLA